MGISENRHLDFEIIASPYTFALSISRDKSAPG
jgi:hypothetical protein